MGATKYLPPPQSTGQVARIATVQAGPRIETAKRGLFKEGFFMLQRINELPSAEIEGLLCLLQEKDCGVSACEPVAADSRAFDAPGFAPADVAVSGGQPAASPGGTVARDQLIEALIARLAEIADYPLVVAGRAGLNRHLVCRAANVLGLNYLSTMSADEIFALCRDEVARRLGEEMQPFIEVSVCMGWADGRLTTDEIEVLDAVLSQLRLLRRVKGRLLTLLSRPLEPTDLQPLLNDLAADESKAWMLLALGWAVAMADRVTTDEEVRAFNELASYLGVGSLHADQIRKLVEKRFCRLTTLQQKSGSVWQDAAQAAVAAAGLEEYLQAATGLQTLFLATGGATGIPDCDPAPPSRAETGDTGRRTGHRSDWILAPALVAGVLFLRGVARTADERLLLVALLVISEKSGG
jgi:tellurite resistance protein